MYSTTDFRKGLKIEMDGEPFVVVECQHVKPGSQIVNNARTMVHIFIT